MHLFTRGRKCTTVVTVILMSRPQMKDLLRSSLVGERFVQRRHFRALLVGPMSRWNAGWGKKGPNDAVSGPSDVFPLHFSFSLATKTDRSQLLNPEV